jgi:hypothetical protein
VLAIAQAVRSTPSTCPRNAETPATSSPAPVCLSACPLRQSAGSRDQAGGKDRQPTRQRSITAPHISRGKFGSLDGSAAEVVGGRVARVSKSPFGVRLWRLLSLLLAVGRLRQNQIHGRASRHKRPRRRARRGCKKSSISSSALPAVPLT